MANLLLIQRHAAIRRYMFAEADEPMPATMISTIFHAETRRLAAARVAAASIPAGHASIDDAMPIFRADYSLMRLSAGTQRIALVICQALFTAHRHASRPRSCRRVVYFSRYRASPGP